MVERQPSYKIHDGFRLPMGFPVAGFIAGQRYRPAPTDIFVSTYPKCGTTWTQYIVYLLLHGAEALPAGKGINDVFPHLEEVGDEAVRTLPEPRLIKTHLPFAKTPWQPLAKYIYVARNPFDCAVSFYHHTRGFVRHYDFAEGTWDTFFECFMRGEVDFGDYFDNLLSWWPERSVSNLLFLTYEHMLADPAGAVRAIATFLGGQSAETAATPLLLERVVALSSFDHMRVDQHRWSSQRPANMPEFVRKGVVGDWANHFSLEQAARLTAKLVLRTAGTGADSLWPELAARS